MTEPITLEVHQGDTIFVSRAEGHCNLHYVEHGGHMEEMLTGFEQFLRGAGFSFDGHLTVCDDDTETQWAIDVRNFLDHLTNPEAYGFAINNEVRIRAAELRDA